MQPNAKTSPSPCPPPLFSHPPLHQDYRRRGLVPRALSHVFREIRSRSAAASITVRVSYIEIYNENMHDLLADPAAEAPEELVIVSERAAREADPVTARASLSTGGSAVFVKGMQVRARVRELCVRA